ncbi:MAG: amino acid ABC transporter substrate-binding protein [Acidimicrobiia bacterium]|nr:amino acid ABC transporter substrate-binding protein [Acidimicrobiia bacterium]
MAPRLTRRPAGGLITVLAVFLLLASSGCSAGSEERVVEVGFYAFFEPVSSSAEADPTSPDFNVHVGYEADLLTAIEAMEGYGLRFNRTAVPQWTDIWLRPAGDEFDLAGGGITILESRTRDDAGEAVVAFTDGHIDFTQSLLVRAEDGPRLPDHEALLPTDVVGVLPNTTGEARLLQILGVADEDGGLAAGTRIETPTGWLTVETDGSLIITAARASPELASRTRLIAADPERPQILYLGEEPGAEVGEPELLAALSEATIDAIARGTAGNTLAAASSDGAFVVTALDFRPERGGFVVDIGDTGLLEQINVAIAWLTDGGRIGLAEWLADPRVFLDRAALWDDRS